jgi:heat shock protein HslJ
MEYIGKEGSAQNFSGTFQWNTSGRTISLSGLSERSIPSTYQVGEDKLIQLDMNGNVITGDLASKYELIKVNELLVDVKWKLIEIKDVDLSTKNFEPEREPFIMFHTDGNRISGNGGCNNFFGTYQAGPGAGLRFSGVASTRMFCFDMAVEDQMNKIFQLVDNYMLNDNDLVLSQGETALAQFKRE